MISIFGTVKNPTSFADSPSSLFTFISSAFKIAGAVAGIFFVIRIIGAGFAYLGANGDEKKTAQAFAIIWQSVIGFAIVASAFVIASLIGYLFGIDPTNIEL